MNNSRAVPGAAALLMLCLAPLAARAALSDAASAVEALSKVRDFEQVAISPDGSQVAWVELLRDASGAPSRNTAIYCKSRNDAAAKPNRISVASGRDAKEHDLAWAPDSRQIAFVSDAEKPGTPQLYTTDCSGRTPRRLTSLSGYLDDPPQGKSVVSRVDCGTARVDELWSGNDFLNANMWMGSLSIGHDGVTSAAVSSSLGHPPEVVAGPVGNWKPITEANSSVHPTWGKVESVSWQ